MSEKMRSEFEVWVKTFNSMPAALFVDDRGCYVDDWIQCRWLGWQASRAALCVELPADKDMSHNHEREAARLSHNDAVEACRDAIHAAGVKTR